MLMHPLRRSFLKYWRSLEVVQHRNGTRDVEKKISGSKPLFTPFWLVKSIAIPWYPTSSPRRWVRGSRRHRPGGWRKWTWNRPFHWRDSWWVQLDELVVHCCSWNVARCHVFNDLERTQYGFVIFAYVTILQVRNDDPQWWPIAYSLWPSSKHRQHRVTVQLGFIFSVSKFLKWPQSSWMVTIVTLW